LRINPAERRVVDVIGQRAINVLSANQQTSHVVGVGSLQVRYLVARPKPALVKGLRDGGAAGSCPFK
jgi:hypothetical protein